MTVAGDSLEPLAITGELLDGMELSQRMTVPAEVLESVSFVTAAYGRENTGVIHLRLEDEDGAAVARGRLEAMLVADMDETLFTLETPLEGYKGKTLAMVLTSEGCAPGNAVSFYYGSAVAAGRFSVVKEIAEDQLFSMNGDKGAGMLCARMTGAQPLTF
jgi:hypothetical protein